MSKTKFTKGDWVCLDNGSYIDVLAVDVDGYFLDQVCMGVSYRNKENAPLLANSKAMYEAMQEFIERVESGEVRSRKTYEKFKLILAKARGEND